MRIGWKMHYLQPITWFYDFFLRKTKIFQNFIRSTKNFFWPKQKNTCLMVLNDKPNCQVSSILMNPRPILSDSSKIYCFCFFEQYRSRIKKNVWRIRKKMFLRSKMKLTPVRPIPSVIWKQKSLTWKHLSKIGRTKFSF
jgi:hypothetical protein